MNRPLKRKLENLILAYLTAYQSGSAYAAITLVTSGGTTLADEIALDAGNTPSPTAEPEIPFCSINVITTADPALPGVASFEIILHLKTTATGGGDPGDAPTDHRNATDAILRALYDTLITPTDDNAAFTDTNKEFARLLTFANLPEDPEDDDRPVYRKPLHLYAIWHTSSPTLQDDDAWHDQLIYAGHAQDMDSHE